MRFIFLKRASKQDSKREMNLTAKTIYKAGIGALLITVQLSPFMATPAVAFELFGIHLWGEKKTTDDPDAVIAEPKHYEVNVEITGKRSNTDGSEAKVDELVESASSLYADRDKPASGAAGLLAKARGDYRRILAALYADGRYGGTISILIDGHEASDIPPDAELPDNVKISIDVDPGPQFLFSQASIINMTAPVEKRRNQLKTPQEIGFADGKVAYSNKILQAERLAVQAWREKGHAKARLKSETVTANHANDTVIADLEIDPGPVAYYGALTVDGTRRVDPEYVAWMTGLKEGEQYNPDDLEKAKKRLGRLEVFRAMTFQEAEEINPDGTLPMTLTVQERLPRRFGFGADYSTLDGFGFNSYWMHRNLFGRAERLRLDAKVTGIGGSQGNSFNPKNYTYLLGASFTKPGVFTPDTDFSGALNAKREVLDAYTETSVTAKAGLTHVFSDTLSGSGYANITQARFEDDYYGKREFTTVGLQGNLLYDGRDSVVDPTTGFYADVYLEPFYEVKGGTFATKFTAEGRAYYGLGSSNRVVLAGRAKIGAIAGGSISDLPPDKLFFAGGGGSVRGYAYRNIGVDVGNDKIVGGRSLIEASGEVRTRITETIGAVAFVDAGYVGKDSIPRFSEELRVGVGGGVRYITGLGPIRLDVALPLDRRSGDPKYAFYVGIGQSF